MSVVIDRVMGTDLSVSNAAKASFLKESRSFTERDRGLLFFLAEHGHWSPYRHAAMRFTVKTTVEDRIRWETGLEHDGVTAYRAGMICRPTLSEILASSAGLKDVITWRWTASLQAIARFVGMFHYATQYPVLQGYACNIGLLLSMRFPVSAEALTGMRTESPVHLALTDVPDLKLPCLDKGYVRLVDFMPGESPEEQLISLEIKAPMMARSQWLKYARGGDHCPPMFLPHPFEEAGSGNGDEGDGFDAMSTRNEASRRYITLPPEFYVPSADQWRGAPANMKQGSAGSLDVAVGERLTTELQSFIDLGISKYEQALGDAAAAEQARGFLANYFMYATWRWTTTMATVNFFLDQRLAHDAQREIYVYAQAVESIVAQLPL